MRSRQYKMVHVLRLACYCRGIVPRKLGVCAKREFKCEPLRLFVWEY